jgi:hypothetical protein
MGRPRNAAPRANTAEIERRVNDVYRLLVAGADRAAILEHGNRQGWAIAASTVDSYIRKASDRLIAESAPARAELLGTAYARFTTLYRLAVTAGDLRAAHAAARSIADLAGLWAPKQTQIDLTAHYPQIEQLQTLAEQRGLSAGELFDALIAQLATSEGGSDE